MTIQEKDFLVINFLAKVKDDNKVFDTSYPEEAKKIGIEDPKPSNLIVGAGMVIKGVDESFIGKEEGQEYTVDVPPEKGFGKRNADLIKMMPSKEFKKQKITPYPGLQMNIDGIPARVITVSPGRVMVDFNFPLAGKDLEYKIKIEKIIKDKKEKVDILLELFKLTAEKEYKENSVIIHLGKEVQEELKNEIKNKIKEFTDYETIFEVKKNGLNGKGSPVKDGTTSGQSSTGSQSSEDV